ncbi:MAG TPA: lipoyl synthase [Chitinivibrionales bacterium]|nr:lipoyl synthase [Chitinivibrionales bacterium]
MTDPQSAAQRRLPSWLKRPLVPTATYRRLEQSLTDAHLNTVCSEAKCPNRAECFSRGTATFLILGSVCTRSCGFCGITHGAPQPVDKDEPRRVAEAVRRMAVSHAVITSVTRDDLPDGGACQFAAVIRLLKREMPAITIEVLVPDFHGNDASLCTVLDEGPHVFNHNIETVPRLYPMVRPQANYSRSLEMLAKAARNEVQLNVKSGVMVGLGETRKEVFSTLDDLRRTGCAMVTIGQYLRPSKDQVPVQEFVTPEQFDEYRNHGLSLGFTEVSAGPFVRSSYRAEEMVKEKMKR